jgi:3-mercaptopyruvate sulfurtransferase SseA
MGVKLGHTEVGIYTGGFREWDTEGQGNKGMENTA